MTVRPWGSSPWTVIVRAAVVVWMLGASAARADDDAGLRLATFVVDATPPLGSAVAYAPARSVTDPLSARGIVLQGSGAPIVLCAVDWIGIGGSGQDVWKEQLARAAGTTPDRVAVHTLHQHDAPRCDFRAEELLAGQGLAGQKFDTRFARDVIRRVAAAIEEGVKRNRPVTHIALGAAAVEKVASNRRILGPDGKVAIVRLSSTRNAEATAAPEGTIDPLVRLVSFWDGETPVASLTYYACHPQSYYGKGDVTSDFVGLARTEREKAIPGVVHVHFNGAGGNVAAGKYNDGSPELRPILTARLADGMRRAWDGAVRQPIAADQVRWQVEPVRLPLAPYVDPVVVRPVLENAQATLAERSQAAWRLSLCERSPQGVPVELACLSLGEARILHMPGELFVEYQLAAQEMRAGRPVFMAAYGDYGPGYIGTEISYGQGGYETSERSSAVAPSVEAVLREGMRKLLR